jgi:hypothetical protein
MHPDIVDPDALKKGVSLMKDITKRNYKAEFGISLKEAKEIVKLRNGRLPRTGWEAVVREGVNGCNANTLWLANLGHGSFTMWLGRAPLPVIGLR